MKGIPFLVRIVSAGLALTVKGFVLVCIVAWSSCISYAVENAAPRFKAVAFDYFVIFDPNSVIPEVEKVFPGKGAEFTKQWRSKQFEYGFLRRLHRATQIFSR